MTATLLRKLLSFGLALFLIACMGIWVMFLNQRHMMYFPPLHVPSADLAALAGFERVGVRTEDGLDITGYFKAPAHEDMPVILAFHGNASHPAWIAPNFTRLLAKGYGLLLAEYRGYGGNPGSPEEDGFYKDARAYRAFLSKGKNPLVLYGISLGTGVAVQLASEENPAAIVLETPYDSMLSVARHHYPFVPFVEYLLKDQFHSIKKIENVRSPSLFIVAGQDEVVPQDLARKLFDRARGPKTLVVLPEAGHNTTYDHNAEEEILRFLEGVFR